MNRTPDTSQSLDDWLAYIEQLHPTEIELGLARVTQVAERADVRQQSSRLVLVAGTNGKGSTCAALEALLQRAGVSVGVFSSPHLFHYRERVRINGEELADEDHCQAFAAIELARGDIQLTYFEYSTLAALWLFKRQQPEVVLLEVGLGGRLDATNLVDPELSVITSIDLDHQDWLGNTRESVAREKAGIMRRAKTTVVGEPDAPKSLYQVAATTGACLVEVNKHFSYTQDQHSWHWNSAAQTYRELAISAFPVQNMATALAVFCQLGYRLPEASVREVLASVTLPGRFQAFATEPRVYLDVGHNPHACRYLAQRLRAVMGSGRLLAVCGMLKDKASHDTLAPLVPLAQHWYLADLQGPRAALAADLADALPTSSHKSSFCDVKTAYLTALADARADDVVIVFGSFYTVAEVIEQSEG